MAKITFETATFADAIKKADQLAPTRGTAFDKAAGILMEFDPTGLPMAVIRSTNLDVFRMEWVDIVSMDGEPTTWRFPKLFGAIIAGLPIGSGKQVILEEKAGQVHITAGRTKAKFNLLDPDYYPRWDPFDPDNMYPAKDLGGRVGQVEWATSKDVVPITGVHLDGEYAVATDKYRLAAVPLEIPDLERPITVPSGFLAQMLKTTGDVQIGIHDNMLQIMPDQYTQIKCVIFAEDYLNYGMFFSKSFSHSVELNRGPLLEIMQRAETFAGNADRVGSAMKMYLGREKIAIVMNNEEVGQLGDVIDTPGFCVHEDRVEIKFSSKNIIDAFSKAPNDKVTFHYDLESCRIVHVDGGSGYRAWIAVRGDAPGS